MAELKTLKDIEKDVEPYHIPINIKEEAIKDLVNIYELEKILKVKLNDKIVGILSKYIMWKNNIKEGDVK